MFDTSLYIYICWLIWWISYPTAKLRLVIMACCGGGIDLGAYGHPSVSFKIHNFCDCDTWCCWLLQHLSNSPHLLCALKFVFLVFRKFLGIRWAFYVTCAFKCEWTFNWYQLVVNTTMVLCMYFNICMCAVDSIPENKFCYEISVKYSQLDIWKITGQRKRMKTVESMARGCYGRSKKAES